jgi:3-phenylpropionate/trans-cinnamate dioxygenase ferredoxin reductase subunit
MSERFVIVGAGQAAVQAAATLRQDGFAGHIVLIGDEAHLPYQRPPLSKKFLAGDLEAHRLYLRPDAFFTDAGIELMLGHRVTAIHRETSEVLLGNGTTVPYDKLLVTIGSRVRRLTVPGEDLPGVYYLRTIDDVLGIRAKFGSGARLVVVGGGYIGLEAAAVAINNGLKVTVLEMESRIMARVTSPEMSAFYDKVHRDAGVDIRLGERVTSFEGTDTLQSVTCADGMQIEADLAIVGIGIAPNCEMASEAGLACDNGIVVDEFSTTNDPNIFAAGDCANHPNDLVGRRIRLESVQNAIDQAKAAAFAMNGHPHPYTEVPWFWSDQYDLKLQIAGLSEGYDETVLRGDPASHQFAMFYLKKGVLISVDAVNAVPEFVVGKKLIGAKARIAPTDLADMSQSMKALGQAAG